MYFGLEGRTYSRAEVKLVDLRDARETRPASCCQSYESIYVAVHQDAVKCLIRRSQNSHAQAKACALYLLKRCLGSSPVIWIFRDFPACCPKEDPKPHQAWGLVLARAAA